jgi:hypothetical protein
MTIPSSLCAPILLTDAIFLNGTLPPCSDSFAEANQTSHDPDDDAELSDDDVEDFNDLVRKAIGELQGLFTVFMVIDTRGSQNKSCERHW